MLKFDDVRMIKGYEVHGDSDKPQHFYVYPNGPQLSIGANGMFQLRFIEYESLREDGEDAFGGFVSFLTDLTIPQADLDAITAELEEEVKRRAPGSTPAITLAQPLYTGGTVELLFMESGNVVEKVRAAASPALYGKNVAAFALELTGLGAKIMAETLSKGANTGVTIIYHLDYYAELPPSTAQGSWSAKKFYTFMQDINTEESFWGEDSYTETISSSRYNSEVTSITGTQVDIPGLTAQENAKLSADMMALVQTQLAAMVERNLITAMADVNPDVKNLHEEQDLEDIKRNISSTQMADVSISFAQKRVVTMKMHPTAMLPTITSMKDGNGNTPDWLKDYYTKISSDAFFNDKRVTVQVNADFEDLPIFSVDVRMTYPFTTPAKSLTLPFHSPDDVGEFESLVVGGKRDVTYTYTVNYENSTFHYVSAEKTEPGNHLTISVDDLGVLVLDVFADGIDWDAVKRAQVHLSYTGAGTPVDKTLNLTKETTSARVTEIIKEARNAPIAYDVLYSLADGRDVKGKPGQIPVGANALTVSDPFSAPKSVTFQALGDLATKIQGITLEAVYTDAENAYTQKTTIMLDASTPAFSWVFPAFDDTKGTVTYSGFISRKDGTSEDIPETTATSGIVRVGDQVDENLVITVDPALLDWTLLKVALVSLTHTASDGAKLRKDFTFKDPAATAQEWTIPLEDSADSGFTSTTTFFLLDGTRKTLGPQPETGTTLFPEIPAA